MTYLNFLIIFLGGPLVALSLLHGLARRGQRPSTLVSRTAWVAVSAASGVAMYGAPNGAVTACSVAPAGANAVAWRASRSVTWALVLGLISSRVGMAAGEQAVYLSLLVHGPPQPDSLALHWCPTHTG